MRGFIIAILVLARDIWRLYQINRRYSGYLPRVEILNRRHKELCENPSHDPTERRRVLGEIHRLADDYQAYVKWLKQVADGSGDLAPPKILLTRLEVPPGFYLRMLIEVFFSKKTCLRVFEPLIAEVQQEWQSAHQEGHHRLAIWFCLRGWFYLGRTVLAQLPISLFRSLYEAWKSIGP